MEDFIYHDLELNNNNLHEFFFDSLNIPELVILILAPTLQIIAANSTFLSLTNEQSAGVINKNFIVFCDNHQLTVPFTNAEINSQQILKNCTKIQRNHSNVYINWCISPLKDPKKKLICYLLIGIDITSQKLAEENERRVKLYFENIINTVPSYIFWKDKNSIFLGCNRLFSESAGLSKPEDIIGKSDYDLPWKTSESETYIADDKKVIESGKPKLNIEEVQTQSNGNIVTLLTNKVPFYDTQNNIEGILAIYTDITERKHMEEALRKAKERAEAADRVKTEFIANMSHDIRTPIAGVIGMAEMLKKDGDTKKDREYGHIIYDSSQRLLALLNDVLEIISADEIREENLIFESFNLPERIKHVNELFSSNATLKDVEFNINIEPGLPDYIISDRLKIDRILLNLIGNALKFTSQGEVTLTAKLLVNEQDKTIIEFIVSDTGVGISEDQVDKIFDRFYRASPSHEGKYTGFGIGLFIVKKFVSLLNGTIKVKSELGKGTTFRVTLPVKADKQVNIKTNNNISSYAENTLLNVQQPKIFKHINPATEKKKHNFKVLFIEDDNIAKRTGRYFLEAAGFNVQAVSNSEEAIKIAKSETFNLVITDIGLPGIDGNEFTLLFRNWERKLGKAPLPIIGLSAHAGGEAKKEALRVGMDTILEKPLSQQKILLILDILQGNKNLTGDTQLLHYSSTVALDKDLPATEAELFKLEQYPLFNYEEILEKATDNNEMLRELLMLLVKETIPEELNNIEKAYKINDWATIQKLAHKLKGTALYCGTNRMRYACQYLEKYQLAGHHESLKKLYQQLINVLKDTQHFITEWLDSAT